EAIGAQREGADWIVFGPVYDTASKRAYGPPQGLNRLAEVTGVVKIPVIAIGGITPERVAEVLAAGARGVGGGSGILAAASPADGAPRYIKEPASSTS